MCCVDVVLFLIPLFISVSLASHLATTMPEWREVHVHQATAQSFLETLAKTPSGTELLHLWADAGDKDKGTHPTDKHVFRLGPNDQFQRGNTSGQTLIVPTHEQLCSMGNPNAQLVSDLTPKMTLLGIHGNGRAIFLDFGFIYLKVCVYLSVHIPFLLLLLMRWNL